MSRIQINLLPDIKMQTIKQQRARGLVTSVATLATLASAALFLIMLLTVYGVQRQQLSSAEKGLNAAKSQLENTPNLTKILTVQNQLAALSGLHQNKHISSRVFKYLTEVTPSNAQVGRVSIDFKTNSLQLDGTANNHHTVNTFVDTLKFTKFKIGANPERPAFTSVVESSFGISSVGASYTLEMSFDPQLFSNTVLDARGRPVMPVLSVPKTTTTRSILKDPANVLFDGQTAPQNPKEEN